MTSAPDERPDRPTPHDRSGSVAAGPLTLWILVQLTALALAAARVPLLYRAPQPLERVAVHYVLAAQIVAAALLFPWLMRNVATGLCVILVSAPFAQLAALLAEVELSRAAVAWGFAALWMSALLAWSAVLRASARARLVAVALAGALAIVGPVLRYLRYEFFHFDQPTSETTQWIDPVSCALAQLQAGPMDAWPWVAGACLLAGGVLARTWSGRRAVAPSYPHD